MDDELTELRETVETLRERVDELERRIAQGEEKNATTGRYDRYDQDVIALVGDVSTARPRELMKAYSKAGVRDRTKRKERAKRLKALEAERGEKK